MRPFNLGRKTLILAAATCLLTCCERAKDASPPLGLNQMPVAQLRAMLKGFDGDCRPDSDKEHGLPPPPAEKAIPPDAICISLVPPEKFQSRGMDLQQAIASRRSIRSFSQTPMTLEELSFLLWATQGVTAELPGDESHEPTRLRAAPSAGGRYPLETYIAIRSVEGLDPGLYRYLPNTHQLHLVRKDSDISAGLQKACYGTPFVAEAAAVLIWSAIPYRTEWKYTYTSHRMIAMEAGHVCQNLYLAATSAGLGACALCSYHQSTVDGLLGVDGQNEFAIYLACVGRPSEGKK